MGIEGWTSWRRGRESSSGRNEVVCCCVLLVVILLLFEVILVTILVLLDGLPLLRVLSIVSVVLHDYRLANGHVELVSTDQTTMGRCGNTGNRIFWDLIQLRGDCRIAAHDDEEDGGRWMARAETVDGDEEGPRRRNNNPSSAPEISLNGNNAGHCHE